jgi:prepilin peptidase dependent protein B
VRQPSISCRRRGLSIVEFMVGIAVGLFVVGGAAKLFADYMVTNKRQMLDTRVNQELRAAADIIARDLRRAGYWENAAAGVSAASNPYAVASSPSSGLITYAYARNADNVLDNNEQAGFRLQNVGGINVLQMQDGLNNWQAITDAGTLEVTNFSVTSPATPLGNDMAKYCPCLSKLTCVDADMDDVTKNPLGRRRMSIMSFQIVLTGRAINDQAITRTVNETVRVRNPVLTGGCPPP